MCRHWDPSKFSPFLYRPIIYFMLWISVPFSMNLLLDQLPLVSILFHKLWLIYFGLKQSSVLFGGIAIMSCIIESRWLITKC